jgi:3-oxoacyl-[acyl-carrier protein] reductase
MTMIPATASYYFPSARVLITGAAGGLGSALARAFAEAGASLVLHYRRDPGKARSLLESLPGKGHLLLEAEAGDETSVETAMKDLESRGFCLDVLVNNAGSYPVEALADIGAEDFRSVLDANLSSAHIFSRAALPLLGPGSSIINIASVEALRPALGHAHYAAAKAALIQYTKSQALELAARGIRANAISPGLIDREGLSEAWPQGLASWNRASPSGRPGGPSEVAAACLFLASGAASWINGINLVVDGGASCAAPQDPGLFA